MVGTEGTKIFDFDNSRSLEKGLSGNELHRKLLLLTKKVLKLLLKNVKKILFGRIFLGALTAQTVTRLGSPLESNTNKSYLRSKNSKISFPVKIFIC